MNDIANYVSKETLDNIYNRNSNVLGIITNTELEENGRGIGTVVLFVNLKKKSYFKYGDVISYNKSKLQWSSIADDDGCKLYLINPYWCKAYNHDVKIPCDVEVLKSVDDNGERKYYKSTEKMFLTKKQYIKRYNIELFGDVKYRMIAACENMWERFNEHKDYYKALNESAKHYLIDHTVLKKCYGKYTRAAGVAVSRWEKFKVEYYTQNQNQKVLEEKLNALKRKTDSNVIEFKLESKVV